MYRYVSLVAAMLLLAVASLSPVSAGTQVLTTGSTLLGTPSVVNIGAFGPTGQSVWKNNLNATTLGLVVLVLRASTGQTIYYSIGTITPSPGANSTAYNTIFGVPSGTYSATWFVMSAGWVAMSTPTTVSITFV
ncbi:MAG TPA: hypothetical protein VLU99_05100 [Nitrososphaerales archaeon]|nr:hypothetical protein [Nitrososphaerales archaeon]